VKRPDLGGVPAWRLPDLGGVLLLVLGAVAVGE